MCPPLLLPALLTDRMVIRVLSPPQSPSTRSSFSSSASHDELLTVKMQRSDSLKSVRTPQKQSSSDAAVIVEPSSDEERLSFEDLFDPGRTAKENKSLLMSAELDRMGMGRYQWCVFFLCGAGFFIDLLWAQAFGLVAVPLENEPGFNANNYNIGLLSTAFSVGLAVGAFTWGILVDVIGRRWSFNLTCLIAGIFGISSGASPSFTALRVLAAFVGVGVGGNIPIDATITMEILPTNRRFLLAMLSLFQPVGVLVASGIAYGFIPKYSCGGGEVTVQTTCTKADNMGWRYYLYTLGALTFFIFFIRFVLFSFQESPAYLINRGMDEKALASVSRIAKINKKSTLQFGMDEFEEIDRRCRRFEDTEENRGSSQYHESKQTYLQSLQDASQAMLIQFKRGKLLFANKTMARTTILLWLTYAADYFGFSIAGVYLPLILRDRGIESNVSLSETYRDYIAVYAPGIAACLLGAYMIELPKLGRQWSMVVASTLMAVSMFVYTTVNSQPASVGLNALEYFMQSLFNSILYAYTPAVYPSAIRGSASGITSGIGRVASIIAPIAAGHLYGPGGADAARNTLFLGGGITLLCPVALALLPHDTGSQLVF